MKKERSRSKRIGIDILGYAALIGSALTGWLPGPGGIPLLILGLSLLATNHEWAERWLQSIKTRSGTLGDDILGIHPYMKYVVDIVAIVLIALAALVFTQISSGILRSTSISLVVMGTLLLMYNQKRIHRLKNKVKKPKT